jgi:antitoxin component YwqK of YwqJK toxin-antitoxin module
MSYVEEGNMKKALLVLLIVFLSGCSSEEVKKEYYPNGKLKTEMRYKNGKLDGMTKGYYDSGKLKAEAVFKDDKMVSAVCYDENGNKIECPKFNDEKQEDE